MREIKFRLWCKNNNEWEKDLWWMGCEGNLYTPIKNQLTTLNKNNHILDQYTGLKDKNGKEIYEGDIYKKNENTYLVEYSGFSFMCVQIFDSWLKKNILDRNQKTWLSILDEKYIEIIGNIHENPELLK